MRADFSITFDPGITREQAEKIVKALEDYYKACGGQSFEVSFEEMSPLLAMTVAEYLTEERWESVHGTRNGWTRAYNCLMTTVRSNPTLKTIGDIVALKRRRLFEIPNFGRTTFEMLEAVFKHDGIEL